MKAIKTLALASALVAVTSAANATTWPITMSTDVYIEAAAGPFIVDFAGFYDDVSQVGHVGGQVFIPGFVTTINYQDIAFSIDPTSGEGVLNAPDSSASNCTANTTSACAGFSPSLTGSLYNAINFSYTTDGSGNKINTSTGTPFSLAESTFTWTLVIDAARTGNHDFILIPFTVQGTNLVPIPATAWLFGSGLIGLAGATRKRKFI